VVAAHGGVPPRLGTRVVFVVLGAALLGLGGWTAGWYRLLRPRRAG
jgi:hypothetical protein